MHIIKVQTDRISFTLILRIDLKASNIKTYQEKYFVQYLDHFQL